MRGGAQKEQTDQNKRLECHKDANDDDDKDDDDKDLLCWVAVWQCGGGWAWLGDRSVPRMRRPRGAPQLYPHRPTLPLPLGRSELMMMRGCWWWWPCHYITGWEVKTSMMMRQKDWHTGVPHEYLGTLIESWIQKAQMSDNENFRSPLESERA